MIPALRIAEIKTTNLWRRMRNEGVDHNRVVTVSFKKK